MKLRVKTALGHRLTLEVPTSCTLADLRALVAERANLGTDQQDDIVISLNKRDALRGAVEAPIRELGVCPGDLLWLLSPQPASPVTAARTDIEPATEPGGKRSRDGGGGAQTLSPSQQIQAPNSPQEVPGPHEAMQVGSGELWQGTPHPGGAGIGRGERLPDGEPTLEPLPDSRRTPTHLLRVLHSNCDTDVQPSVVLLLAAHAAMLETGFQPTWASTSPTSTFGSSILDAYTVLSSCWTSRSVCRLEYCLPLDPSAKGDSGSGSSISSGVGSTGKCTLHCSIMGGSVLLAAAAQRHTRHLSVQAASFLQHWTTHHGSEDVPASSSASPAPGVGLRSDGSALVAGRLQLKAGACRRLWAALKDGLAFPMLLAVHAEAGLPPPAGLLALPEDLKQAVLGALGPQDVAAAACACCELRHLGAADELWEPLLRAHFPHPPPHLMEQAPRRGYKWVFGQCWLERRRREEALRRARARAFAPAVPRFGAPPPFYPPPHRPGYPVTVGGDYDRLPQLGTGMPGLGASSTGVGQGGWFLGGSSRRQGGLGSFRIL